MKKLIFTLIFVLMMGLSFTSCTKHDFDFDPTANVTTAYNKAFVSTFGTPDTYQNWGFTSGATTTRSAQPNSNQWGTNEWDGRYLNFPKPADITQDEIDAVLKVFNKVGAERYTSLVDWDKFFVQQVWKGTAEHPTHAPNQSVIGGNQMDWLCAYDPNTNSDDHINNFNNANGSVMLMFDSSTRRFGFKSSSDNGHVFYNFRMELINGYYYVGLDFEANGQNPNEQVDRDYIYNDWIVKIVPGKGTIIPTPEHLRIIAEDLSAHQGTDFDFNDIVLDVDIENSIASCKLIAAGGTLPLRINGDDNLEVHKMFGVNTNVMVNTGIGDPIAPVSFSLSGINNASQIKLEVFKNETWMEMKAEQGVPAAKIAVFQNFEYCAEREPITKKYPNFKNWVKDVNYIWW